MNSYFPKSEITKDQILKIISSHFDDKGKKPDFISAINNIYKHEDELLSPDKISDKAWISNGVSLWNMFPGYIDQINCDISNHSYYKFYDSSAGNPGARQALAILENQKFNKTIYDGEDFCLTEGATGAISATFEVFKTLYPDGEILIPSPTYYIFHLSAEKNKISFREIDMLSENKFDGVNLSPAEKILKNINQKTKMIVLCQPENPTGRVYLESEITQILRVAKEKNIWVLFDEVFFDLIYKPVDIKQSDLVSYNENYLDGVVMIKSFSKNRNMPAFRMGYIFSKIGGFMSRIESIMEERVSTSGGSNFQRVVIMDCFYLTVLKYHNLNLQKTILQIISEVKVLFGKSNLILSGDNEQLLTGFLAFSKYIDDMLDFYEKNFLETISMIKPYLGGFFLSESGFNSFVNIKKLDGQNSFDFMLNLYLSTGIMIQPGTYFGFSQKDWDNKLGFWLRITSGSDVRLLKSNLIRFIEFADLYIKYPNKYIHTGLTF